jgi:hypothetical protein
MNSRHRLPSFVVFALSSIIRHLSSVLCALCAFVVKSFLPDLPVLPVNLAFFPRGGAPSSWFLGASFLNRATHALKVPSSLHQASRRKLFWTAVMMDEGW